MGSHDARPRDAAGPPPPRSSTSASPAAVESLQRLGDELDRVLGAVDDAELDRLFRAGTELCRAGERSRASDVFRFVALSDPTRGEAWSALASCHEASGDLEGAAQLYEMGWLLCPADTTLGLHAARAYALLGAADDAEALLDDVLEEPLDEVHARAASAVRALLQRGAA